MPAAAADDMNDESMHMCRASGGVSLHLSPASTSASMSSICFRFSDHRQVDYCCGVEIFLME
jgi:hypothetical protein